MVARGARAVLAIEGQRVLSANVFKRYFQEVSSQPSARSFCMVWSWMATVRRLRWLLSTMALSTTKPTTSGIARSTHMQSNMHVISSR
eukprot:560549-Amphidinium_carterae.2